MEDYQKLEKHFRIHEALPVEHFSHLGYEVYIGEGGPFFEKNPDYPCGWYETAYAVGKGTKILFYQPLEFDFVHDMNLSDKARRQARINSAKKAAMEHIQRARYAENKV